MSDEKTEIETTEDAPFAVDDAEEPTPAKSRRGLVLILIAVVILALSGGGWYLFQQMQSVTATDESAAAVARLNAELSSSREALNAMSDRLGEQQSALREERERVGALAATVADLEATISRPAELLGSVPSRVSALERGIASLQGISEGTRDNWLLAEAEYFLQVANAQAELARNATLAAAALRQADERVAELSNPAYTAVRAEIADELTALSLIAETDIAGMTLTLASLSRVVDSLPIKQDDSESPEEDAPIEIDANGLQRAWSAVQETASRLVTVTRPGEERSPLLTPESETLLRANLSLQIQAARLALLKSEPQVFRESLEDADAWLTTYFDTDSVQVQSARATLNDIGSTPAMNDVPDISGSLEQLRRLSNIEASEQ